MNTTSNRSITPTAVLFAAGAIAGCTTLPDDVQRTPSHAMAPNPEVALAEVGAALRETHGDDSSGFRSLERAESALRWRLILIDRAEETLDAQYYIWHGASGALVMERLLQAADRGVRVRVLVDDFTVHESDLDLARLGSHPNFELRLFNPEHLRKGPPGARSVSSLRRVQEVNQRMHNKLLVADNHLAVLGGRNIGDEYFGLRSDFNFLDLDVVVVGPVVPDLSSRFDLYWNSEMAFPASALGEGIEPQELDIVRDRIRNTVKENRAILSSFLPESLGADASLRDLPGDLIAGAPEVLWDAVSGQAPRQVADSLSEFLDTATEEVILMVAYVIPTPLFMERLRATVERGVRVTILTNSLSSLDTQIANAFFKKYRPQILEAGAELHELRPDARDRSFVETPPVKGDTVGMHTKLMIVDRRRVFVGSFNLEPRAVHHNREDGLLIDSPDLAAGLAAYAERFMEQENSWRLRLDESGRVLWESYDGVLDQQPARSSWQRLADALIATFPVPEEYL